MPESSGPVFGRSSSFDEEFPGVQSAMVSYTEWPTEQTEHDGKRTASIRGDCEAPHLAGAGQR
jgi:hypothetical protein